MKCITITDENGLHARPASEIVAVAKKFDGEVYLEKSGKKGNAKSIMMLMSLAIVKGDTVEIVAEGKDSEEIEEEIEKVILNSDKEALL